MTMLKRLAFLFFLILIFHILIFHFQIADADTIPFFKGIASRAFPTPDFIKGIGGNSVCVFFNWGAVEAEIGEAYNWQEIDESIYGYQKAGLNILAIIGSGLDCDLPKYNGEPATPDRLGRERYLNNISLFASAFAKRYKGAVMAIFLENEVNEAAAAVCFGWRSSILWGDYTFVDELIQRLASEVRKQDPTVLVGLSLRTDVPDGIHQSFFGFFVGNRTFAESAKVLGQYVDILGLSFFPNFFSSEVLLGELSSRVEKIRALTGKPIVALSVGYPSLTKGQNPPPVDWTEEKQALFIERALGEAWNANLKGFLYFDADSTGRSPFNYQKKDLEAIEKLGKAFREGDADKLLGLMIELGSSYKDSFIAALMGGDGYGLLWPGGLKRDGYYALQDWFGDIGNGKFFFIITKPSMAPTAFQPLVGKQNYPNPFNRDTWMPYELSSDSNVVIKIYSSTGLLIRKLDLGQQSAGLYIAKEKAAYWDGCNEVGEPVVSGVYCSVIEGAGVVGATTRPMVLLK